MDAPTEARGRPGDGVDGNAGRPSAMPGMATDEQIDELGESAGSDADELFVELMAAHHQGGIEMPGRRARGATTRRRRLRRVVARRGQADEIAELEAQLAARRPTARRLTALPYTPVRWPAASILPCSPRRARCRVRPSAARLAVGGVAERRRRTRRARPRRSPAHRRRPTSTAPTTTAPPPTTGGVVGTVRRSARSSTSATPSRERFYDAYLAAALADIQAWWSEQYPSLYGEPFDAARAAGSTPPIRSAPTRSPGAGTGQDQLPGSQSTTAPSTARTATSWPTTTARTASSSTLAEKFGPSVVAVVMAHEFGHAIQGRPATSIVTCRRSTPSSRPTASPARGRGGRGNGEAAGHHVRRRRHRASGMIALVEVARPGRHRASSNRAATARRSTASAPSRRASRRPRHCADLIDHPLPLLPNEFATERRRRDDGNARSAAGEQDQIIGILDSDLTSSGRRSSSTIGVSLPTCRSGGRRSGARQLRRLADELTVRARCTARRSNEMLFDEALRPRAVRRLRRLRRRLHHRPGVGEAVQTAMGARWQGDAGARLRLPHRRVDRLGASPLRQRRLDAVPQARSCRPATSTRRSRPPSSSATRAPATTCRAARSRRSPACASACSTACRPATPTSRADRPRTDDRGRRANATALAALDIGTNSIHLVVARPVDGDGFETLTPSGRWSASAPAAGT